MYKSFAICLITQNIFDVALSSKIKHKRWGNDRIWNWILHMTYMIKKYVAVSLKNQKFYLNIAGASSIMIHNQICIFSIIDIYLSFICCNKAMDNES